MSVVSRGVLEPDAGDSEDVEFTICLAEESDKDVTITVNVGENPSAPNPATAGDDFVGVSDLAVTMPAGETTLPFPVTVLGDDYYERVELYRITASNETNTATGVGVITDDDSLPELNIVSRAFPEGNDPSNSHVLTFPVTLTGPIPLFVLLTTFWSGPCLSPCIASLQEGSNRVAG